MEFSSSILNSLKGNLLDKRVSALYDEITHLFDEQIVSAQTDKKGAKLSNCILTVIRPRVSSFLDTVRELHSATLEELLELVQEYTRQLNEPTVRLIETKPRGYHL